MEKCILIPDEVALLKQELATYEDVDKRLMAEFKDIQETENVTLIKGNVASVISPSLLYAKARRDNIQNVLNKYQEPEFYTDEQIEIGTSFTFNIISDGKIIETCERTLVASEYVHDERFLAVTSSLGQKLHHKRLGDIIKANGYDDLNRKIENTIVITSIYCKYINQTSKTR